MASLEVKVTGHSHSARDTLHYISYGTYGDDSSVHLNQPHANQNGITKRNYLLTGINCRSSYKQSLKDFDIFLKKKPNNKVQTLNVVLSFGHELDWRNFEDSFEGYTIAKKFVLKAFPNHQAIIAEQEDNHGGYAHVHCIINAISMKAPYNTIPGGHSTKWYQHHPNAEYQPVSYGIEHLRKVARATLHDVNENDKGFTHHIRNLSGENRKLFRDSHQRATLTNVKLNYYQNHVYHAVAKVLSNTSINTKSKFRNALKQYNVRASFKRPGSRRRSKRGKRRSRRRYRRAGIVFRVDTKNGHVVPIQRGLKKIKGIRRHYIKASVLARKDKTFSYQTIMNGLRRNQQSARTVQSDRSSELSSVYAMEQSVRRSRPSTIPSLSRAKSASKASSASSAIASSSSVIRASSAIYSAYKSISASVSSAAVKYSSQLSSAKLDSGTNAFVFGSRAKASQDRSRKSMLSTNSGLASVNASSAVVTSYRSQANAYYSKYRSAVGSEVDRVKATLAKFDGDLKKRMGAYNYAHAIPMYCIGYRGTIPEFNINPNERPVMKRLLAPVVRGFQHRSKWIVSKWNAGKAYLHQKFGHISLMGLAKSTSLFKRIKSTKIAREFISRWKQNQSTFNMLIAPVKQTTANSASSASAKASRASSISSNIATVSASYTKRSRTVSSTNAFFAKINESIFSKQSASASREISSLADASLSASSLASYIATPAGQSSVFASQSAYRSFISSAERTASIAKSRTSLSHADFKTNSKAQNSKSVEFQNIIHGNSNSSSQNQNIVRHQNNQSQGPDWT